MIYIRDILLSHNRRLNLKKKNSCSFSFKDKWKKSTKSMVRKKTWLTIWILKKNQSMIARLKISRIVVLLDIKYIYDVKNKHICTWSPSQHFDYITNISKFIFLSMCKNSVRTKAWHLFKKQKYMKNSVWSNHKFCEQNKRKLYESNSLRTNSILLKYLCLNKTHA